MTYGEQKQILLKDAFIKYHKFFDAIAINEREKKELSDQVAGFTDMMQFMNVSKTMNLIYIAFNEYKESERKLNDFNEYFINNRINPDDTIK